jgi:hypothetical protein
LASGYEYVNGSVSGTWTQANGPYVVTDDICVQSGQSLTIEPGVEVRFDDDKSLYVDGSLAVEGTAVEKVTFTSNSSSPGIGSWWMIQFNETSNGTSSRIQHVEIEYAFVGIVLVNTSIWIQNTTFRMSGTGVRLIGASATIAEDTFDGNFFGVSCFAGSNATIAGNLFYDSIDTAILIQDSLSSITGNVLDGNSQGIRLEGQSLAEIHGNEIKRSTGCGLCLVEESSATVSQTNLSSNQRGIMLLDSSLDATDVLIESCESGATMVSSAMRMENSKILNSSLDGLFADNSPPDHLDPSRVHL